MFETLDRWAAWVGWEAIAAIGTMLAVWLALWTVMDESRRRREAEANALLRGAVVATSLTAMLRTVLKLAPAIAPPAARYALSAPTVRTHVEELTELARAVGGNVRAWHDILSTRTAVADGLMLLESIAEGDESVIEASEVLTTLASAASSLSRQAELARANVVWRRVVRLRHFLTDRNIIAPRDLWGRFEARASARG